MRQIVVVATALILLILGFFVGLKFPRKLTGSSSNIRIESIKLDKDEYESGDLVNIKISIYSPTSLENTDITLIGLTSKYGRNYINLKKNIDLKSGYNSIEFSSKLPHCGTCVGVLPGSYEIKAEISHGGKLLSFASTTLELRR